MSIKSKRQKKTNLRICGGGGRYRFQVIHWENLFRLLMIRQISPSFLGYLLHLNSLFQASCYLRLGCVRGVLATKVILIWDLFRVQQSQNHPSGRQQKVEFMGTVLQRPSSFLDPHHSDKELLAITTIKSLWGTNQANGKCINKSIN